MLYIGQSTLQTIQGVIVEVPATDNTLLWVAGVAVPIVLALLAWLGRSMRP